MLALAPHGASRQHRHAGRGAGEHPDLRLPVEAEEGLVHAPEVFGRLVAEDAQGLLLEVGGAAAPPAERAARREVGLLDDEMRGGVVDRPEDAVLHELGRRSAHASADDSEPEVSRPPAGERYDLCPLEGEKVRGRAGRSASRRAPSPREL
jgi:hypothetical protein